MRKEMPEKVIVFLGPSLPEEEAYDILRPYPAGGGDIPDDPDGTDTSVIYRLPAARGDITKAVADGADLICLIDGVFFESSSVGHKEIMAALKAGVRMIGAASMGALRACETDIFGMTGIGTVYEMYRSGEIESDDEVAVLCSPVTGEALSEALVNIRKTLEKAQSQNVVTAEEREILLKTAVDMYYPDRTYDSLIGKAEKEKAIDPETLSSLRNWLPGNARDVKREDAVSALKTVAGMIRQKTDG